MGLERGMGETDSAFLWSKRKSAYITASILRERSENYLARIPVAGYQIQWLKADCSRCGIRMPFAGHGRGGKANWEIQGDTFIVNRNIGKQSGKGKGNHERTDQEPRRKAPQADIL